MLFKDSWSARVSFFVAFDTFDLALKGGFEMLWFKKFFEFYELLSAYLFY